MAESNQIFDLIRASIGQIPFNALLGIELAEIEKDRARVILPWKPELGRSTGTVHGGVTATLLDVVGAAAVASNLGVSSSKAFATISLLVNYLD
ncbi:MAG: PaaI family thioesterase, partial [Proteobacteria bacterium]|nr:PaaI family thioesterase [Pseudomonadota bacterium]